MLSGFLGATKEEIRDAKLQMPLLRYRSTRPFELALHGVNGVAQGLVLRGPLTETVAQLLDRAGVALFAFQEQGLNVGLYAFHSAFSNLLCHHIKTRRNDSV